MSMKVRDMVSENVNIDQLYPENLLEHISDFNQQKSKFSREFFIHLVSAFYMFHWLKIREAFHNLVT